MTRGRPVNRIKTIQSNYRLPLPIHNYIKNAASGKLSEAKVITELVLHVSPDTEQEMTLLGYEKPGQ